MTSAFRIRPRIVALCLFATTVSGCHDSNSDPLAVLLTEETRSVLAAEAALPSLPKLVAEAQADEELAAAVTRWAESWDLPVTEGRQARIQASVEAAAPVARGIGQAGVANAVRSVGETLVAAASLKTGALAEGIAENLEQAEVEHSQAVAELAEGREVDALSSALHAADLIREVGPESVTRLLLSRAEARLVVLTSQEEAAQAQSQSDGATVVTPAVVEPDQQQIDLERGRRLIRGARIALDSGDYVLAIQRAYYACQVLGADADG